MAQVLIIFESILNGEALLESKEIQALCNHQFGGCELSVGETDQAEGLHDWLNDELHKAINGNYGQVYRMKVPFSNLEGDNGTGEYSGPVCVHLFEPDAAVDDGILLLTCNWKGSIFSNDHYVCGVVADEDDLARMLDKVDGNLIVSKEESSVKEEPALDPRKLTTKEVIKYLNDLTKKADEVRSFSQLEELDDKKREFWDSLDDKTKQMKTVIALMATSSSSPTVSSPPSPRARKTSPPTSSWRLPSGWRRIRKTLPIWVRMIKSCEYDNDMALIRKTCPACCGQGRYRDYSYVLPQEGYLPQWKTCWKCDGKVLKV